jgi:hypothetical protein
VHPQFSTEDMTITMSAKLIPTSAGLQSSLQRIDIESIAARTDFQRRQALKITALHFLMGLSTAAIGTQTASLAVCAREASIAARCCISKQAFAERVNDTTVDFARECLAALLQTKLPSPATLASIDALGGFGRVLVGDSTTVALDPSLANAFPGSRNGSGKDKAQFKVQTVIDLKRGQPICYELTSFRYNDQRAAADVLPLLRPNDVLIRDLGYFSLKVFDQIARRGAYVVSRYRYPVKLLDPRTREPMQLLRLLRKRGWVDMRVLAGADQRVPMRLVAQPAPPEVAAKRRHELLQNRDMRCNPSKEHLALQDWTIILTAIPEHMATGEQVCRLSALRWGIEILFKAWKSHFGFRNIHPTASVQQVQLLVYARLIAITAFQMFIQPNAQAHIHRTTGRHVSILKLANFFAEDSESITELKRTQEGLKLLESIVYQHCTYERRKRVPYPVKITQCSQSEMPMLT